MLVFFLLDGSPRVGDTASPQNSGILMGGILQAFLRPPGEKASLRKEIEILEQMVATQQAQLDEINAVIGPQGGGELDLDSIQLEVTTEPRGAVDLPPRYDLIDVVDEQSEAPHEQE